MSSNFEELGGVEMAYRTLIRAALAASESSTPDEDGNIKCKNCFLSVKCDCVGATSGAEEEEGSLQQVAIMARNSLANLGGWDYYG